MTNKIELLSPAGSFAALKAAVSAGCDAVYVGMKEFSCRAYAENFDKESIIEAIDYCHIFSVKIYVAVNIQIYDKEFKSAIELIVYLWNNGVDGLIISNFGLSSYLHNHYPDIEIHASTQATNQNAYSSYILKEMGFSRMVAPREISFEDLKILSEKSEIEIELFIHGALCVCHSGQCLLSSMIGTRSGNRGECAQPCRMKYEGKTEYPLSLKDMNLSSHITDIMSLNISSLKIEGRMKAPEYVYIVTKVYRTLLDEKRNANLDEEKMLNDIFSRSGSTDAYFTGKIDERMLGTRTSEDKKKTSSINDFKIEEKKIPLKVKCILKKNEMSYIKGIFSHNGNEIEYDCFGDLVNEAKSYPLTYDGVSKSISKFGNTVFALETLNLELDDSINLPVSSLNNLRRKMTNGLLEKIKVTRNLEYIEPHIRLYNKKNIEEKKIALFTNCKSVTKESCKYFDEIYVDVFSYREASKIIPKNKLGVFLPPVILDTEIEWFSDVLSDIKEHGCKKVLLSNLSQIQICKENNFDITLSHRFNIYNQKDIEFFNSLGIKKIVCSSEIGLDRAKRLNNDISTLFVIAYGRIPLMTLEKCIIRDILGLKSKRIDCKYCENNQFVDLKDSTKAVFKVLGYGSKYRHRNILFNSVPVWMADKYDSITNSGLNGLYIFTCESQNEVDNVISSYKSKKAKTNNFRRI